MQKLGTGSLDFNAWKDLASRDPAAFEERRNETVQALIERVPQERRARMWCLQWRIDQVRKRARTPMVSCLSVYGMMWDSLVGRGGLAEKLNQLGAGLEGTRPPRSAEIIRLLPRG